MCGIAGLVRFDGQPVLETDVRSMCHVMIHRGPDEEGVFLGAGVGMGMRRLSIIDLSGGQQPVSNEDGSIWVVFNGEIYNYPELRERLTRNGRRTGSPAASRCAHGRESCGLRSRSLLQKLSRRRTTGLSRALNSWCSHVWNSRVRRLRP